MGKPRRVNHDDSAQAGSVPGEVKHLSTQRKRNRIDAPSSGERKGQSLNFFLVMQITGKEGNKGRTLNF
ncbi:MAG: hypothetical protein A3C88_00955 [Candidatus Yanofskybacteria bacterium RIFCSPHIGHO2_02_FULL_50_12]|uniref:Uncharacterized protein n=1 Tax=Candidatus Yanofskybacteria bacterium RIFCSPHIGHO2_02_FULL_50_12 TaxID=1802685 RepID=A0A1F8FXU6_9BACT|nr:MAG: hypothetical protein A3C88_00955 [Candidatus Yanofskybacteria bacterium RIFCSPHIGHO2_02_FULL_50_12]